MDYTGTYKGETVPGAEAKGVSQIVGADFYIDGVADKLKGVKKGDTFTVKSKLTDAIFGDYVGKKPLLRLPSRMSRKHYRNRPMHG